MMDRRAFITVVGGSMLAGPLAAKAQQVKVYRVGVLEGFASGPRKPTRVFCDNAARSRVYRRTEHCH